MMTVFDTIIGAGQAGPSLAERLTKGAMTVHRRKTERGGDRNMDHVASHNTPACLVANELLVILGRIATSSKNRKRLRRTHTATLKTI
jgi:hypothetical protein